MHRSEIYWADLGRTSGSRPAKRRPVLVVQSEPYNDSRLASVLTAMITSNTAIATNARQRLSPGRSHGAASRLGRQRHRTGHAQQGRPHRLGRATSSEPHARCRPRIAPSARAVTDPSHTSSPRPTLDHPRRSRPGRAERRVGRRPPDQPVVRNGNIDAVMHRAYEDKITSTGGSRTPPRPAES